MEVLMIVARILWREYHNDSVFGKSFTQNISIDSIHLYRGIILGPEL